MRSTAQSRAAFTLIELLTVISIIMILAGLTAAGVSRAVTNARINSLESRMRNVSTLLYDHYGQNGTYPPRYGYIQPDVRDERLDCDQDGVFPEAGVDVTPRQDSDCLNATNTAPLVPPAPNDDIPLLPREHFVLTSYMNLINETGNLDLYDPFASNYDTDNDGTIHYLEFSPLRDAAAEDGDILYEDGTLGAPNNQTEASEMELEAESRPFLYFPVNKRQAERVGTEYELLADDQGNNNGEYEPGIDPAPMPDDAVAVNTVLQDMATGDLAIPRVSEFPPPKYDAFVLMSVGPNENTFGMVTQLANRLDLTQYDPEYRYHVLGTVLYYVLSRDADEDGLLDFHYIDRTRNDETDFQLLDLEQPNGAGPYIFVSE